MTENTMSPWLEEKRKELEQRMAELKPLVDEYKLIEAAHAALIGAPKRSSRQTPDRRDT